ENQVMALKERGIAAEFLSSTQTSQEKNKVLTEYMVQDLNVNPQLPFEDRSFDVITNV
ncbi:hypothetical protein Droror1_Dr00006499, partial [Drosera rotundifolia]